MQCFGDVSRGICTPSPALLFLKPSAYEIKRVSVVSTFSKKKLKLSKGAINRNSKRKVTTLSRKVLLGQGLEIDTISAAKYSCGLLFGGDSVQRLYLLETLVIKRGV